MLNKLPILSILIWFPIVSAAVLIFFAGDDKRKAIARSIALVTSVIVLAICITVWVEFNRNTASMQFVELYHWIPVYGINYYLGIDGISMPLVLLTCFTTFVVILASWKLIKTKVAQYLAAFLVMQGMVVGVFCACDTILFYVFWEAMLIPMYLSIGIWGSNNRSYAAIKFFLFTFFGSALMLIALIYMGIKSNGFSISQFDSLPLSMHEQIYIFIAFLLAFGIKIPLWPVHTWLPDAHTEAPAGGSVVLAALMLKLGAYGFLRFSLPMLPDASAYFAPFMIVLSLIAIVYIGFIALAQTDMKKLIAYSSIAHMGFVTLGAFMIYLIIPRTLNQLDAQLSIEGAMMQMITHAFGSGAMFIAFGFLYERIKTRMISDFGGIATVMPWFATFFMVFAMSNVGLPGTSGFIGEFFIILASFKASFWITLLASTTLVIGAGYTLWMYKRVFFGPIVHENVQSLEPIGSLEMFTFGLLAFVIIYLGFFPNALVSVFHASVNHTISMATAYKVR